MNEIFPKPILNLPKVDIPFDGVEAYLSQGENYQIIFMKFEKDTEIPKHSHESQWEIVLEGKVDYYERGVKHYAKVFSGYASIVFFNQKDRYKKKSLIFYDLSI